VWSWSPATWAMAMVVAVALLMVSWGLFI